MDVSTIIIDNADGTKAKAELADSAARARIEALRKAMAETNAIIDSGGTPDEPTDENYTSIEQAYAALDAAWNTDEVWSAMKKAGNVVRANPEAFDKYVGETVTYTHAEYGEQTLRVVAVAHYDNADGSGKAAFVLEHAGIPLLSKINASNVTGGYAATSIKESLDSTFYEGMPIDFRDMIQSVSVPYAASSGSATSTTECKVFLLSETEVFGTYQYANEGTRLAWYAGNDTNADRKKKYGSDDKSWWLRTPSANNYWCDVSNGGAIHYTGVTIEYGISPVFNVG